MVERGKHLLSHGEFRNANADDGHLVEEPHHEARAFLVRHVGEVVPHLADCGAQAQLAFRAGVASRLAHAFVLARGAALLNEAAEEGRVGRIEGHTPAMRGAEDIQRLMPDHRVNQAFLFLGLAKVAHHGEHDGERGQALLAVDDVGRPAVARADHDDGAKEINGPRSKGLKQILDQDLHLGVFPGISPLEGRNPDICSRTEDIADALDFSGDRHEVRFPN